MKITFLIPNTYIWTVPDNLCLKLEIIGVSLTMILNSLIIWLVNKNIMSQTVVSVEPESSVLSDYERYSHWIIAKTTLINRLCESINNGLTFLNTWERYISCRCQKWHHSNEQNREESPLSTSGENPSPRREWYIMTAAIRHCLKLTFFGSSRPKCCQTFEVYSWFWAPLETYGMVCALLRKESDWIVPLSLNKVVIKKQHYRHLLKEIHNTADCIQKTESIPHALK